MENWAFLVAAYTTAWVGVMVYVFVNIKKLRELERKVADLGDALRRKDENPDVLRAGN